MRFYERQFITRNQANKDIIVKFEQLLDEYFQNQVAITEGLPSVKYFADKACLSPNYFGDLIKKETGKNCTGIYPVPDYRTGKRKNTGRCSNSQPSGL